MQVQRIAPGIYKVGGREVRIHKVQSVSYISFSRRRIDDLGQPRQPKHGPFMPLLLGYTATRALMARHFGKATDGCDVAVDGYCSHGHPSNAILWGLV